MKQLIALSALGTDRTGLVYDLTRVVTECGGNILDSRMVAVGNEFAILMLVAGNWHTLAKLEGELARFGETSGLAVTTRRTEARPARPDMMAFSVDVMCLDQPGVLHALSGFFSSRGIEMGEINTRTFTSTHTGAPMFSLYMVVHVPNRIHIAALREEFMDLCDHMNLDAILEPLKA
jgi:glycine cleavage system transcriptional repressor